MDRIVDNTYEFSYFWTLIVLNFSFLLTFEFLELSESYIVNSKYFYLCDYSLPLLDGFSNLEEVIAKFAQLTPQERAKRYS